MSQPKNPELGLLDRDRANRTMMRMGSKRLLDTLQVRHPRIVRLLQVKHGIELKD